jgi:hypothetical protein
MIVDPKRFMKKFLTVYIAYRVAHTGAPFAALRAQFAFVMFVAKH